jgi:hypothetical protein
MAWLGAGWTFRAVELRSIPRTWVSRTLFGDGLDAVDAGREDFGLDSGGFLPEFFAFPGFGEDLVEAFLLLDALVEVCGDGDEA